MNKNDIRKEILKMRLVQSIDDVTSKSESIFKTLRESANYKSAKTIMAYLSFSGEVSTHEFIKTALLDGKRIFVPKIQKDYQMKALEILDFENLKTNILGILEPFEGTEFNKHEIDLFVVPALAFDKSFNRAGFGKGYYDRFLKDTKGVKIGVAFEFQIVDQIETNEFDIPMDSIVTEKSWRNR